MVRFDAGARAKRRDGFFRSWNHAMYKRILIVLDPPEVSRAAMQEGMRLAAVHGSEVIFFTMLPNYPLVGDFPMYDSVSMREFDMASKAQADRLLAAARVAADKSGVTARYSTGRGDPVKAAVDAIKRLRADLAVVPSEGRNALLRLLTGSIIPGLITLSPVPVLVVKDRARRATSVRAAAAKPARKTKRSTRPPVSARARGR
jgi:nucleotide-binding universal stress UspA family protein